MVNISLQMEVPAPKGPVHAGSDAVIDGRDDLMANLEVQTQRPGDNVLRKVALVALGLVVVLIAGAEIVALVIWAPGAFADQLSALFGIMGIYGTVIGFVARYESFSRLRLLDDLTSHNVALYLSGNCMLLAIAFSLLTVATAKSSEPEAPTGLRSAGKLIMLALVPLTWLYSLFHVFVMVPIAYLPIVAASSIVAAVRYSGADMEFQLKPDPGVEATPSVSMKELVQGNEVSAKGFVMGLPALLVSLLGQILAALVGS